MAEMYYSRPFKQDQQSSGRGSGYHNSDHLNDSSQHNKDWYQQHGLGPGHRPNPQKSGQQPQQESITGMLNNFSKALGKSTFILHFFALEQRRGLYISSRAGYWLRSLTFYHSLFFALDSIG